LHRIFGFDKEGNIFGLRTYVAKPHANTHQKQEGLSAAFEMLKERVNAWSALRQLTDYKLSHVNMAMNYPRTLALSNKDLVSRSHFKD
jgi:hypothetical protein